ncbi:hypothetical protein GCM10017714_00240 [Curtobacterium pusillum]
MGSVCTHPTASPMLRPHDGVGGVTPTARNDSAASAPIMDGIEIVAYTVIVAARFGSSWVRMTCQRPAPIAVDATT